MKKKFLFLYLSIIISVGYSLNVDYGSTIDSFAGTAFDDPISVFGFEKVSLYSSIFINDSASFAIDGYYKYSYTSSTPEDNEHTFDVSTFLAIFPIGSASFQLGRNYFSDYGGAILSHTLDGLSVTLPLGFANVIVNGGYTGLQSIMNKNDISLIQTAKDEDDIKKIIDGLDVIKDIGAITVWGSLYSVQDMNSSKNLPVYIGGGVSGGIGSDLFYTVKGNFNTGLYPYLETKTDGTTEEQSALILAGLGDVSLNWYIKSENPIVKKISPSLSANIGISSGDENLVSSGLGESQSDDISDGVNYYVPMVSGGPGTIYSTNKSNLTFLKLAASISPLKDFQTQLGSVVFFRTIEGVTSDSEVDANADGHYMGTEVSLTANYRPFSDLGISLSGGVFLPDGTVIDSDPSVMLTAYVSLSL